MSAKEDYKEFWVRNPQQDNPSDINTKEKFEFAMAIGWERLRQMQSARKRGEPYTKR